MAKEDTINDDLLESFITLADNASKDFFNQVSFFEHSSFKPSKSYYSHLLTSTDLLEIFLDNSGARGNKNWLFFTELVASIRNFVIAASQLQHIIDRFNEYDIGLPEEERKEFLKEAHVTMEFINNILRLMVMSVKEEGSRIGLKVPVPKHIRAVRKEATFPSLHLPQDLSEEEVSVRDLTEKIMDLSRRFRKVCKIWREKRLGKKYEEKKFLELIPTKIDEKWLRKLKNIIHGVQSDYDTYVRNTNEEVENSSLVKLRGHVSISLHLFYIGIWLTHFYERHENQIRKSETKHKISKIVSKEQLLERIMNFVIFYTGKFLEEGNRYAENNLTFYITKACYKLPIPKPQGFHARPATYVSLIVNEHGSDVFMIVDDVKYSARSVMSILEAGWNISEQGYGEVYFEGDKRVLDDLKILSDHNYCEDEDIPRELNYLRILRNL
jgi:phosphotransferase system HPr-like phosphotransfer protein